MIIESFALALPGFCRLDSFTPAVQFARDGDEKGKWEGMTTGDLSEEEKVRCTGGCRQEGVSVNLWGCVICALSLLQAILVEGEYCFCTSVNTTVS